MSALPYSPSEGIELEHPHLPRQIPQLSIAPLPSFARRGVSHRWRRPALQSSVTRTDTNGTLWGPGQRITVEEAIRVSTLNGACASFEEREKGSLSPGKLADLVVLRQHPTAVDPSAPVEVPVERTMVGGRWVFEA